MRKSTKVILAILFLGAVLSFPWQSYSKVCFDGGCLKVEVADDPLTRQQGLKYRKILGDDEGMLFVFEDDGRYVFWMKDTLMPLDIIWVNSSYEVVDVDNALPCEAEPCARYTTEEDIRYVVEVNAGVAGKLSVDEGDEVRIHVDDENG